MDQSAQNLPQSNQTAPNQSTPANQLQPQNSSFNNLKSKFSTFSSRPKAAILAAIIVAVLLIVALLSFIILEQSRKRTSLPASTPMPSADSSMPKENVPIAAVNGQILYIKTDGNKTVFEVSSYSTPWQKTWQVTLSEKTILVDEDGWQANSLSGDSLIPGAINPAKEIVSNLAIKDFKVGDVIYMIAAEGQDFRSEGIDGPATIVKLKL